MGYRDLEHFPLLPKYHMSRCLHQPLHAPAAACRGARDPGAADWASSRHLPGISQAERRCSHVFLFYLCVLPLPVSCTAPGCPKVHVTKRALLHLYDPGRCTSIVDLALQQHEHRSRSWCRAGYVGFPQVIAPIRQLESRTRVDFMIFLLCALGKYEFNSTPDPPNTGLPIAHIASLLEQLSVDFQTRSDQLDDVKDVSPFERLSP